MEEEKKVKPTKKTKDSVHLLVKEQTANTFKKLQQQLGCTSQNKALEFMLGKIEELTQLTPNLNQSIKEWFDFENQKLTEVNRENLTTELTQELTTKLNLVNQELTSELTQVNQELTSELDRVNQELSEVKERLNLELNRELTPAQPPVSNLRAVFGNVDFAILRWTARREQVSLKREEKISPEEMLYMMFKRYMNYETYLCDRPTKKVYRVFNEKYKENV